MRENGHILKCLSEKKPSSATGSHSRAHFATERENASAEK